MRRKYVRKWLLLRKNRICPEVAVDGQILPAKSKKFKLPEKIEIFRKFAWKNRNVFDRIQDPQISNQIDAVGSNSIYRQCVITKIFNVTLLH